MILPIPIAAFRWLTAGGTKAGFFFGEPAVIPPRRFFAENTSCPHHYPLRLLVRLFFRDATV